MFLRLRTLFNVSSFQRKHEKNIIIYCIIAVIIRHSLSIEICRIRLKLGYVKKLTNSTLYNVRCYNFVEKNIAGLCQCAGDLSPVLWQAGNLCGAFT